MIGLCPTCKQIFDWDGFFEHGVSTLYLCDCGQILEEGRVTGSVRKVRGKVDLTGLNERGLFINKSRWKKSLKKKKKILPVFDYDSKTLIDSPY